jgi:iron complex transport system ATP-binding protein
MALAQQTDLLLPDEPTTPRHQPPKSTSCGCPANSTGTTGRTIVTVLHDLKLVCRFSDHLIAMSDGGILAEGSPADVITAEPVEKAVGLPCVVVGEDSLRAAGQLCKTNLVVDGGRC